MAKILIVDDEREFTEMVALRLRKTGGYETIEAYDGEEGLKLAQETRPDLIILDVMLPKICGYDVFLKLRASEETKKIPVIVLTASAAPATAEKFLQKGVEGYIIKPFDPKELMEKISKCLTRV